MNDKTINTDVTMAGEGHSLLANRYRVVKQLGQGGMGSVWLAEDTVLDNRKVAIKMLPSILFANKRAYNQLKSEALVAMKLSHPNIAAVRSFEENDGNPFIVEDYIEGLSLDNYLAEKGGTLTEEEMRKILAPVAAALDYAHEKGVVHRDVKPGNVMIAADGTPFVLDFGIAREAQETMTMVTGKLSSGTLLYMGPEQLRGQAPTPAQDVYSFAAMAYECLSGHPPFFRGAIEDQIKNEPPPDLGPQFANCGPVLDGLAKDPANRPATCAAVLAPGGVSEAGGTPVPQAAATPSSRKMLPLVALAMLLLASIGGLFAWRAHERNIAAEAREAELVRLRERAAQEKAAAEAAAAERIRETEAETAKRLAAAQAEAERLKKTQEEQAAAWEKQEAERKAREQAEAERREAERKAAEAEKLRQEEERKAAEEAAAREARSVTEAAQRKREEFRQLGVARVGIELQTETLKALLAKVDDYRSDREGFASAFAAIDACTGLVAQVAAPESLVTATNRLAELKAANATVEERFGWIKANVDARNTARQARADLAAKVDKDLVTFKVAEFASPECQAAQKSRAVGDTAFESGDFPEAEARYAEAGKLYATALATAKRVLHDTALGRAEAYAQAGKWEPSRQEAEAALKIDPKSEAAQKAKDAALAHLEPSLQVEVVLDGQPVTGAKVRFAGETKTTPLAALKPKKGETVGPFAVAFEANGKRYVAQEKAVMVDWLGPRTVELVLKEYTRPRAGDTKTVTLPGGAKLELVYCPPGEFLMGSPTTEMGREDDEKQHRVTLTKGFWIGKYEVTQAQWKSVMGNNPSQFKGDVRPVEQVSWDNCQAFLKTAGLGLRLPTGAEWEYACRAGSTGPYAGTGRLDEMGWYDDNSGSTTHPVGLKKPNAWGLYDMHGNVCEWCQDWYGSYDGDARDPQGPASGGCRVIRGGSWFYYARICRSAYRFRFIPGYRNFSLGFRVVCSEDPREDGSTLAVSESAGVDVSHPDKNAVSQDQSEATVYIVQRGDTLAKISKRYDITINAIRRANPQLKDDTVRLGQKLTLPGKLAINEQGDSGDSFAKHGAKPYAPYTGATTDYVVMTGDVLGAVAHRHGLSVRQLKDLNGLSSDVLRVGMKLKVPVAKSLGQGAHKAGDTKTVTLPGGAKLELVYCPPGEFLMGSPVSEEGRHDGEKQHRVTLTKGFWIGKYEVTQAQWTSVMGNNPSYFKGDDRPVEQVSWDDCQEFLKKAGLGLRLPTEAEWEYACRAGSTTALNSGRNLKIHGMFNGPALDDIAWYGGNSSVGFELSNGCDCSGWKEKQYAGSKAGSHSVGQKKPNAWGLYDMHGNVSEWCQDWFGSYDGDVRDPQGPASGDSRVLRGGCWFIFARNCRSAYRFWLTPGPGGRDFGLGFRVACSAGPREESSSSLVSETAVAEGALPDKNAASPDKSEATLYIVQPGDTLAKISKRFDITNRQLKDLNGLSSDVLRVGMKLKVPVAKAWAKVLTRPVIRRP